MTDDADRDEVRALLKLEPHPTCGFVRITYTSTQTIAPGGLPAPFADGRPMGSALYFMVTPDAAGAAAPHPQRPALSLLSRRPDRGADAACRRHHAVRDRRPRSARRPARCSSSFPATRSIPRASSDARRWFLGASTEWPGVEPADVELGDLDALAAQYPAVAADLRSIRRKVSRRAELSPVRHAR